MPGTYWSLFLLLGVIALLIITGASVYLWRKRVTGAVYKDNSYLILVILLILAILSIGTFVGFIFLGGIVL